MSERSIEEVNGIGPRRATILREAGFDSVERLREANLEQLAAVEGIGESLADRIKSAVGTKRSNHRRSSLIVSGQVRAEADEVGVHGLTVEVWEREAIADRLATAHTAEDGRFSVAVDEHLAAKLHSEREQGNPRLYVRVKDRTDALIYSTENDDTRGVDDGRVHFDVGIDVQRLERHFREPTTFEDTPAGLIPDEHWKDIDAAIELLAAPGESGYNALRQAALCPAPPFAEFEDSIFRDAWGTIRGDPVAEQRFRDTLETAMAFRMGSCERLGQRVTDDVVESIYEGGYSKRSAMVSGGQSRTMTAEKVVPLTLATMQLAGGDRELGMGYLGTLFDQFCGIEMVGAIHRSALDALGGDPGAIDRFGGILGTVGIECGPDDGPIPEFPPKRPPVCPPPPDPCAVDVVRTVRELGPAIFGTTYNVTEVTPERACAGEIVTIEGEGFGRTEGEVYFGGVEAEVLSWSEDEIEVRVPEGAGCGLHLSILEDTIEVCGRFVDVYKRGRFDATFAGAAPQITDLRVNGDRTRPCIEPDSDARISWRTCAVDDLVVRILDEDDDVMATHHPAAGETSWTWDVPDYIETRELTVRLDAEGQCDPDETTRELELIIHSIPNPRVQGMEVTQAIQHYRAAQHLTDASDRGPDNSLQLVAGKPAWVRVYVRSGQDPSFNGGAVEDMTGTLSVERFTDGSWTTVATLSPVNAGGTVTANANPGYAAERGDIDATLNFVIPANRFRGELRLSVETDAPDPCAGTVDASRTTNVTATLRQRLRVAGIMVEYDGPDGAGNDITLAAPTVANLRATAALSYTMLPVASPRTTDFRVSGTITWEDPLTDPAVSPGGCSSNWLDLNAEVRDVMTADDDQDGWVFYGLLPNGVPMGPVIGCGGGAVGTGSNGGQGTMVHEVGHAVGLQHAPCGTPGDPNYPAYEPYDPVNTPGARLGPYGLDITDGTIHPPQ